MTDTELLHRIDNRTVETLQRVNETRAEVSELRGYWMALEHRVKLLEGRTLPAPPPGPMRPKLPSQSEKDLARKLREVERKVEEVEETTGRFKIDEKDQQIISLKQEIAKRDKSNIRYINWGLHVLAGIIIAVLSVLLTAKLTGH